MSLKFFAVTITFFLFSSLTGCTEEIADEMLSEKLPTPTSSTQWQSSDSLSGSLKYSASIYAEIPGLATCNGCSFQGFAVYNEIAFCFYNSGICRTVDLITKTIIAQFNLPPAVHHMRNHAGVACFSEDFYDDDDEFPLLYLSSYLENKCYVLRMNREGAELVQSIYTYEQVVDGQGDNLVPVLAYEPDGSLLLLKLRDANYHWVSINRPNVHQGGVVFLDYRDKIDDYEVHSTSAYNAGFALHGKIYQLAGYSRNDYKLYILDYLSKRVIVDENWNNELLTDYEQEQCSRFRNGLLINYSRRDQLVYVELLNWDF